MTESDSFMQMDEDLKAAFIKISLLENRRVEHEVHGQGFRCKKRTDTDPP